MAKKLASTASFDQKSNTIALFEQGSMNVEQTGQLIQLILNSLLLVTTCVIVLSSLLMRYSSIVHRFRAAQQEYFKLLQGAEQFRGDRLKQLHSQLRALRQHYRLTHLSVLIAHYALLFCVASTLVMAFRAFIPVDGLIHLALALFVIGITILMISIGVTLFDLYRANQSVWQEMNWALSLGKAQPVVLSGAPMKRASRRSSPKPLRKQAINL